MAYEALARKYRPRIFEEVVGQGPIVKTLGNALREKRIHHAYVFSGVRGVGKTTVARIFAKALNCEKGPTPTPCLKCDPCMEIAAGRDLDVIEMDAASRTGVDDVRDLIDTTRYAPARDRYKVFIIDEFHMLSKPAFNALLKTLEEPPARVVFIMATTELHKVLPTVLSRTQQFDFRKVAVQEIADQLAAIAKAEKVKAPRAALEMLARAGDGSVRDAESLLDQAIAFCGSEIGEAEVRTLLGLVPEETVEDFLGAVADRDAGALVRMIAAALAEGLDLRLFHAGLVEGVRRLLVLKSVQEPSEILGLSEEDEKRLGSLASRFSTDSLLRVFSVLAGLEAPLKYSDQPRFLLEAAAIRMSSIAELSPIEDLIARLEGGERPTSPRPSAPAGVSRTPAPVPGARSAPASPPGRSGAPVRRTRSEAASEAITAPGAAGAGGPVDDPGPGDDDRGPSDPGDETPALAAPAARDTAGPTAAPPAAGGDETALVRSFLARLRERKEALAMLVEHASAVFQEGRKLIVMFDDAQTFLRKSAEQPANVAILKETAAALLGAGGSAEIRRGPVPAGALSPSRMAGASASGPLPAEGVDEVPPPSADPGARASSTVRAGTPAEGAGADPATGTGGLFAAQEPPPLQEERLDFGDASEDLAGLPAAAAGTPRKAPASGAATVPAPSPSAESAAPAGVTGARYQRLHAQALEDPVVKSLVSRFGGRIVEIKEVP